MSLEEQIENAGGSIQYYQDLEKSINFLVSVNNYEHFKTILELVEVDVINNGYIGINGVSFSSELYKGEIKKS